MFEWLLRTTLDYVIYYVYMLRSDDRTPFISQSQQPIHSNRIDAGSRNGSHAPNFSELFSSILVRGGRW